MKKHFLLLTMFTISLFTLTASKAQQTGKDHQKHENVLNLTADQQAKLKAIKKTEKEQAKAIKADSSISAEDRKKKIKDLHSSFSQQQKAILTPEQQAKQDSLRATHKKFGKGGKKKGQTAFSNMKKLNLSDQQKASLKSLHQTQKDKIASIKTNTNLSDQEKKQQIASIHKDGRAEFQKLLTPEQKEQLQKSRPYRKRSTTQSNNG
ncbi:MAG: hypothetical protein DI598_03305 [Pseudopedobacter saltans]|uniref:LTXXQ motif family protein n=1 Tax=Pseudopedobacter saltans TaxID=151895 RepID=A0A2W5FCM6_9SPHI|nr:MAG: hypothetical protein DI598_03305 [Pseudopedobacter saltans]